MKILYVTTISNTVNAFLIPHIKFLIEQGHQVDVAFNIVQEVKPEIVELGCNIYNIEFQRSPLKLANYIAYKKIRKLIVENKYELVHTHTPVASLCVRIACRHINNTKVIYTAHGFHFYKGAPLMNWLIFYPIERILARCTDVIITINKEDFIIANKFKAKKVYLVHGIGLNLDEFRNVSIDIKKKRQELGLKEDSIVLLSVGELSKRKNHEVIIKALANIRSDVAYVICGEGKLYEYLKELSKSLKVNVVFLGYRNDIAQIYKACDIFVFPSKQEGLPVALMEAIAAGLQIVCSRIRGNTDLIEDGKDGYLVEPGNINGFSTTINSVINKNKNNTSEINKKLEKFEINNVLKEMLMIYKKLELMG